MNSKDIIMVHSSDLHVTMIIRLASMAGTELQAWRVSFMRLAQLVRTLCCLRVTRSKAIACHNTFSIGREA